MSATTRCLVGLVRGYQLLIRPLIGANCRFEPHCSAYAIEALRRHGALRGSVLAAWRVVRCNPWHECGCDPVPERLNGRFGRRPVAS